MARKKHRGSSKIKYEHAMIPGLRKLLEEIEPWPEIKSIVPGEIRRSSSFVSLRLVVQYQTQTGVKCLAKSGGAVQEVFIVGAKPSKLEERLRDFLGLG